jgi:hypothetical protein
LGRPVFSESHIADNGTSVLPSAHSLLSSLYDNFVIALQYSRDLETRSINADNVLDAITISVDSSTLT